MDFYYGLDHQPISVEEAGLLFEQGDKRRVGFDEVEGYEISTVFLVIDHSFSRFASETNDHTPILYETMIFAPKDDPLGLDNEEWRYATREQAELGHNATVELVRRRLRENA